jgi:cytoskeletal protein CcmA (bactofilin family)
MAMFKKSDDNDRPNITSPPRIGESRSIQSQNVYVIGPTLFFKGELSAEEDLFIEGRIEGTIAHHKQNLTIGKQGRVKADIDATSVIIKGQLVGDIKSDGIVTLAKGADVEGNIFCARLVMEDGARFTGKIDMGEPPKATVPKELSAEELRLAQESINAITGEFTSDGRTGSHRQIQQSGRPNDKI